MENEKWLDQQLSNKPDIDDNGFSESILAEIKAQQIRHNKSRALILISSCLLSALLLILITPWNWVSENVAQVSSFLTNMTSMSELPEHSLILILIILTLCVTAFFVGQETS